MLGIFLSVPLDYQWILTLVLAALKIGSQKILVSLFSKAKEERDLNFEFATQCKVTSMHTLFLILMLGSSASNLTSYSIYAIDAVLNLKACYGVIKEFKKYGTEDRREVQYAILSMMTEEILEILLSSMYAMVLCVAYYGTNSEILGNIGNDYWAYEKITDITETLKGTIILLLADLTLLIMSFFFIWKFCKIAATYHFLRWMECYWKPTAIIIAYLLNSVSVLIKEFLDNRKNKKS